MVQPGSKAFCLVNLLRLCACALPAAALLSPRPAEAVLNFFIYESTGSVFVESRGSLNLPGPLGTGTCDFASLIRAQEAALFFCNPVGRPYRSYLLAGPASFGTGGIVFATSSGTDYGGGITGVPARFNIDASYVNDSPINFSSAFAGKTLADLGLTALGSSPVGTWTLQSNGSDGYTANDTINVFIGSVPPEPVPGPLPLLGAAAAFGYSRRLRRRVVQSRPPR